MGMGRWGRAARLVLLVLMLGMLGKTAVGPVGAQNATPTSPGDGVPACTIAAEDDFYTTLPDTSLNDPDPGVFANDSSDTAFTLFDVLPASHGMATVGSMGELNYTPDAGFVGTDSFQYKIYCMNNEGQQSIATATVTISVEENEPIPPCAAVNDSYTVTNDTLLTVPAPGFVANDTLPAVGSIYNVNQPLHGAATAHADGSFEYTPNLGFVGKDSFTYTLKCDAPDQDDDDLLPKNLKIATVTINVVSDDATPVPPCTITAVDDMYTTPKDTALNVPDPGVFANDTSSATVLLFDVLPAAHGMATVGSFGELNYTPNTGFVGTDSFQYKIYCMNEAGEQSYATGTVYITVGDSTVPTTTSVPSTKTPVPSVTKTPVVGQPTAPSVSKLPVTGAGVSSHESMNVAAFAAVALMIVATGALTAFGIARRQR